MSVARIIACAIAGLVAAAMAAHAASPRRTITCPYPHDPDEHLSVVAPAKIGDLPPIDFDYPARVTRFSFRDGQLLLIAIDQEERSRVRIVVSAQLNKAKGSYDGQIVLDLGGHEIMMQHGPVSCTVSP
jgi:RecB family endonuclease NucS